MGFFNEEGQAQAEAATGGACDGRAAPQALALDLNKEHLTTQNTFRPVSTCFDAKNWFVRQDYPGPCEDGNFVLKIQPFTSGGYEATCRLLNLPNLANMSMARRRRGKRVQVEHNEEALKKSIFRARRQLRLSVKNIGADRLFTLTRRESEADKAAWWNPKDWSDAWAKFIRMAKRAGIDLAYVAVLEHHKKGNYHLHVAITGFINVNLARRIWLVICGGKGMGNVDVRAKNHGLHRFEKSARIARYISKYITKGFEENVRFNKKRYWASRHDMPAAKRIILNSLDINAAFREVCELYSLNPSALFIDRHGYFVFPNDSGFWLTYHPCQDLEPPF